MYIYSIMCFFLTQSLDYLFELFNHMYICLCSSKQIKSECAEKEKSESSEETIWLKGPTCFVFRLNIFQSL